MAIESAPPTLRPTGSAPGGSVPPWIDPAVRSKCWAVCCAGPGLFVPLIWWRLPPAEGLAAPQISVLIWTLAICAVTDWRWKKIPNWASYPALIWLLLIAVATGWHGVANESPDPDTAGTPQAFPPVLESIGATLIGGLACFAVMYFVFKMSGGGAGDVKLATVIGAALGVEAGFAALVASYVLAAVTILTWLSWTVGPRVVVASFLRKLGQTLFPTAVTPANGAENQILQQRVALGPFFAAGTLVIVLRLTEMWP